MLPILIRSFYKKRDKKISLDKLNKTVTIMAVIAIALCIGEFCYFRNFQKDLDKQLEEKRSSQNEQNTQNLQDANAEINNNVDNTETNNSEVENTEVEKENITNNITNNISVNEM